MASARRSVSPRSAPRKALSTATTCRRPEYAMVTGPAVVRARTDVWASAFDGLLIQTGRTRGPRHQPAPAWNYAAAASLPPGAKPQLISLSSADPDDISAQTDLIGVPLPVRGEEPSAGPNGGSVRVLPRPPASLCVTAIEVARGPPPGRIRCDGPAGRHRRSEGEVHPIQYPAMDGHVVRHPARCLPDEDGQAGLATESSKSLLRTGLTAIPSAARPALPGRERSTAQITVLTVAPRSRNAKAA